MLINIETKIVPFGQVILKFGKPIVSVEEHQEVPDQTPLYYYVPQETSARIPDFQYNLRLTNRNCSSPIYNIAEEKAKFPVYWHIDFEILLGKIASNWEIIKPLLVKIEQDEEGSYLISEEIFAVYGFGDTLFDALQDYKQSLIEYYQLLSPRSEHDISTQTLFRHLQQYLRKTDG